MSSPYESADLLVKLYDLRREATMREALGVFAKIEPFLAEYRTKIVATADR